jgi:hypothetical protein
MILDVALTANDFVHYLRGFLEGKEKLTAEELLLVKEKLREVYTYSKSPFYPAYSPYPSMPNPFITENPGIIRGPTCTGDPVRNDLK